MAELLTRLKRLKPRHLDILRRMVIGQPDVEIALELGLNDAYVRSLKREQVFADKLEEMKAEINDRFMQSRTDVADILMDAAQNAAPKLKEVVDSGTLNGLDVPIPYQLKTIWDVLDRTGHSAVNKHAVGFVDMGKLVAEAYKQKYKKDTPEVIDA